MARQNRKLQQGASMIEVLVTIVIIAFGLLGMAGLQSRMQLSEMEAYQRAQALLLLNDIAGRMTTNRSNARTDGYITTSMTGAAIGPDSTCSSITSANAQTQSDLREWCNAIQGSAVASSVNSKAGAVIGGRGCIEALGNNEYLITVAWQGLTPISAPLDSVTCGSGAYNIGGDTGCVNEVCRRVVTTVVRIANLI